MNENRIVLVLIIGVIAIVMFDVYTKYAKDKAKSDLKSQELASETMLQMQQQQAGEPDRGWLGNISANIPFIGDWF